MRGSVVLDVFEKPPKELNSFVHKMSLSLKHLNSQQEFGHLELSRDINSQDDEKEPTLSFDQKVQLKTIWAESFGDAREEDLGERG